MKSKAKVKKATAKPKLAATQMKAETYRFSSSWVRVPDGEPKPPAELTITTEVPVEALVSENQRLGAEVKFLRSERDAMLAGRAALLRELAAAGRQLADYRSKEADECTAAAGGIVGLAT